LDINKIINELKSERARIDKAIATLENIRSSAVTAPASVRQPARAARAGKIASKSGGLTPEGRKKLSDLMKKRWADRRRKAQSSK
jgi:Spy/CpxP family protein refolding chaperone